MGSVLVVRSDGRDVTAQQVEALGRFCRFKMGPLFENGLGGGLVEMTKAEVMGYCTPQGFREYFAEVRGKKLEGGRVRGGRMRPRRFRWESCGLRESRIGVASENVSRWMDGIEISC